MLRINSKALSRWFPNIFTRSVDVAIFPIFEIADSHFGKSTRKALCPIKLRLDSDATSLIDEAIFTIVVNDRSVSLGKTENRHILWFYDVFALFIDETPFAV